MMTAPCGNCGPQDIASTIKQACAFLVNGHAGVGEMYKMLAMKAEGADKEVFLQEAAKHVRLAQETATVVVPDGGGDGALPEKAAQSGD